MHQIDRGGVRWRNCGEIALFLLFEAGKNIESPIRCAAGLIWAEMREQREVKATGQRQNEEGSVKTGFFRSQSGR